MPSKQKILDELTDRCPMLLKCKADIWQTYELMIESFANGRKLLVAGNRGSVADAEHIVGE